MPGLFDLSSARQQIDVPFSDWTPDHPPFANPGFPNCENVIPADLGFYRPMRAPVVLGTNTLKDLVAGVTNNAGQLVGVRDPSNNAVFYFTMAVDPVGDTSHFFRYTEATDTWDDVTPAVAPGFNGNDHAYFATFGNKIYAGFSTSTRILTKEIASVSAFAEVAGAPRPRDIITTRGFLVGINFQRGAIPTDIIPTGVTWSASGDPENWIDPVADPIGALSVLRGEIELEGGGRLQRIIPGIAGADAIIFGQRKIWRMTFIGPPAVWDFQIVSEDEGAASPTSVVTDGNLIYFIGRRGWMRFDGVNLEPIGAGKVNRAFTDDDVLGGKFRLDSATLGQFNLGIRSAVSGEPFTDRLVFWAYRSQTDSSFADLLTSTGDTLVTDQGDRIQATIESAFNDTVLCVNELTGAWGNAKIQLQAIGRVETNRTRVDAPRLVGLNNDLSLVVFGNAILSSFFETPESIGAANNRITIRHAWPYVDSLNCSISLLARENLAEVQVQSTPLLQEDDASVPVDESGRYVAIRIDLPASDSWTALLGMSVEIADQGQGGVA